jgi:hypothetical protein
MNHQRDRHETKQLTTQDASARDSGAEKRCQMEAKENIKAYWIVSLTIPMIEAAAAKGLPTVDVAKARYSRVDLVVKNGKLYGVQS